MNPFYFLVKYLMRFCLRVYFRRIRIEGSKNIPKDVPLLVTPNHQNALLDALIVGAFFPRNVYFLTRQDVFNSWTKPILKALKMMPVYRIRDGYSQLKNNDGIFQACFDLFSKNKPVLIFPEGNHGEHHYLRPLTKGAARLALQSEEASDKSLMILPIGINYFDHKAARSSIFLVYGEPIAVSDYRKLYQTNQAMALKELRESMTAGMRETLVIPEDSEGYMQQKGMVFREVNSGLTFEALKDLAATGRTEGKPGRKKRGRIAKWLNPIPFLAIRSLLSNLNDVVFTSTIKFSVGLIAFPLWWLFVFLLSSWLFGTQIGALFVVCMVLGLFYSYQEW